MALPDAAGSPDIPPSTGDFVWGDEVLERSAKLGSERITPSGSLRRRGLWTRNGDIGNYPGADSAWVGENSAVIDDGCWKKVWGEMTDSELEDRLFTYLWLSLHTPNSHAGRVAQLIAEAERRGQHGMVERARVKAETTPAATEPDTLET